MDDEPAFTLEFEPCEGWLYAFVRGDEDTVAVSKRFWREIHDKAVELGYAMVLVEEDFPNQLSTMEMFQVAEYVADTFAEMTRVAHVDRRLADMELNSFGEDVAVNRRLCARVFKARADAEAWLADPG